MYNLKPYYVHETPGLGYAVCRMVDVVEDETTFYSKAEQYWHDVQPTVDGMLGGYGSISTIDINSSKKFLQKFLGVSGRVILA